MMISRASAVLPQSALSRLWLAVALMSASTWSMAAEPDAGKTAAPGAVPISSDTSKDLLRYLISSKSLSLPDAQKLLQQMQGEQEKKTSEDLLRSLISSKALSLTDAQKLVDNLRAAQGLQPVKPESRVTPTPAAMTAKTDTVTPAVTSVPVTANGNGNEKKADVAVSAVTPVVAPVAPTVAEKKVEAAPAEPSGRVRAVYLPDSERQRIRDEIKTEVLAAAKKEGWIQVDAAPEWTRRLSFSGDIMLRQQMELYDERNSNQILNFQAINSDKPFNMLADPLLPPYLNTTEDRNALRLRARLALQATITDELDASLRLTTGNTTTPVSSNQTLGSDFAKTNFLLDRASLRYRPNANLTLLGGRMANPWLAATDLVWDKDISLDGWAGQYRRSFNNNIHTFATLGLFSIENTDGNFPSKSPFKLGSHDKWLYGLQLGGDWRGKEGLSLRGSLAYYDFNNVQGEESSPCDAWYDSVSCDTDHTRPGFVQKGNSMKLLRNVTIWPDISKISPAYEYYALASEYRVVELSTSLDQAMTSTLHAQIDLSVAKNLGFDSNGIFTPALVNNLSACPQDEQNCQQKFVGGDMAYQFQVRVGYPQIREAGQWNTVFGYRYVESDAVMDAFTDSDFHLGGTNSKGYYLGGSIGFSKNAWIGARWLSATEIESDPFAVDVLQLDVNAKF